VAAPFETGSPAALSPELEGRIHSLETRLFGSDSARARDFEAIETIAARLTSIEGALPALTERAALSDELAALERRVDGKIRALEERIATESSAFTRDLEGLRRLLSERTASTVREPEELKLQLAPLLEEQVRRGTDENWTAEIERLRQALAESLDDLSERVRRAVRG
jgi:hypothetical protein